MSIRSMYGVASRVSGSDFKAGIECEIEDIADIQERVETCGYWNIDTDGSLRNNGKEIISKALTKPALLQAFDLLHNSITYKSNDCGVRFSPRTSTHIHINCLDLEDTQVKNIIMWYALFEPVFFLMVDERRRNNIHCVPLDQTILNEHYKRPLKTLHSKWSKYTALNILPLNRYGTIEFRHLEGTDDQEKIGCWLSTLENLWNYGQKLPLTKDCISSEGVIREHFKAIFKDYPEALKLVDSLPTLLSDNLIDIKLSLI